MATTSIDATAAAGEQHGMSEKQELALSWGTSSLLHLGVGLLVAGLFYAVGTQKKNIEAPPVIPVAVKTDMEFTQPDAGLKNSEMERPPLQDLIKDVKNPGRDLDGSLASMLNTSGGMKGLADAEIISLGMNGGNPNGSDSIFKRGTGPIGRPAEYGPPRSWLIPHGIGDPNGASPKRIVFVLDHSGSMLDTFDFLRDEVKKVVKGFGPAQQFSVIMFSEPTDIAVLGPDHLQLALPSAKQDLYDRLDQIRASGRNDDLLEPFTKALGRAFAMNPQVIVFLTDGKFDDRLPDEVAKMNKDKKVKINTIAFVHIEKRSQEQLEQIARDNGGKYKFVREEDLGK